MCVAVRRTAIRSPPPKIQPPKCERANSSRRRFAVGLQVSNQFIDESALTGQYFSPSFRHAEIGDPVDLRKVLCLARTWRPFHLEMIAGKRAQIEISFHGECVHHFPAPLTERCERHEGSRGRKAGFLVEFALCAGKHVAGFDVAFRNRPGALIFVAPIGPAGMCEEQFKCRLSSESENAGAHLRPTRHDRYQGRSTELVTWSRSGEVKHRPTQR